MPNIIGRVYKSAKRKLKARKREQRPTVLFNSARRLLQSSDYEQVSVARIAAEAGCSVGSFYYVFSSKDAFLGALISDVCRIATEHAEAEFATSRWSRCSDEEVALAIVRDLIRSFHGPTAGVFRAALKRAHFDRKNLIPLNAYREKVADLAVALLAHRASNTSVREVAVRAAIQISCATVLDALTQEAGELRAGSCRMAGVLGLVTLNMIGDSELARNQEAKLFEKAREQAGQNGSIAMPVIDVAATPHHAKENAIENCVSARGSKSQLGKAAPKPTSEGNPVRNLAKPIRKQVTYL